MIVVVFAVSVLFICCLAESGKFIQVIFPDGTSVTAELAVTDYERAKGLMFREAMNADQGMLFIFDEEGRHSFWMKNMLISIDILWLNKAKQIVHIEERVPPCKRNPCPSYAPKAPARYVLELKAGSVEGYGLKISDTLNFMVE